MTGDDSLVKELLETQVPTRHERHADWEDVLVRAQVGRSIADASPRPRTPARPRRQRRLLLAAAVLAFLTIAVSALGALGRGAFDGLSSWVRGEPGTPASPEEQAGFAARNAASYAAFPAGTKVRLLRRVTVGAKTFSLLGFRSGESLCLRLARVDLPSGRGANECVTMRELRRSAAPALVVSDAWFRFGDPELSADGIFGFADDTVASVQVRRVRGGWRRFEVTSNTFVALRARPSGTVAAHPPYDPIVQVRAVRRTGERVAVPFIASDQGVYARLPNVPSYLRAPRIRAADLPGPAKAAARFRGGTIAWLERHERRGVAWRPPARLVDEFGTLVFSRAVRPDPSSARRVGLALIRLERGHRMVSTTHRPKLMPGSLILCESELQPLGRGGTGAGCAWPGDRGLFAAERPFTLSGYGPAQITRFIGATADEVATVVLYLASGRTVPAALHDNAYAVSAPTAQFPAKLVAYDRRRRPIAVQVFPGPPRPVPCPAVPLVKPVSALPAPAVYERIDLATWRVNGRPIFGRSPEEVRAALGTPQRVARFSISNGHPEPTFFYGGTLPGSAGLLVQFGWRQHRLRAVSLSYTSPSLVDTRLGHVLRMQPLELQRRIQATYASRYRLDVSYGSLPARGCGASFRANGGVVQLAIGVNPYRPSRPFLNLRHGY